MALKHSFKVRDFRDKGFFMIDDMYLNGYAKKLGLSTSAIYFALCRCADKEQTAFPSQDYIADKIGIHPRTVRRHIKKLVDWNIIKKEQIRNHKGHFLHNTYYLLDKSEWKPLSGGHQRPTDNGRTPVSLSGGHQRPHKETHIKGTHTLSIRRKKFSSLKAIGENEMLGVAEAYGVPLSFVKSKLDDLENYCARTGRRYKNYLAALRNFVKQDAIKIKQEMIQGGDLVE